MIILFLDMLLPVFLRLMYLSTFDIPFNYFHKTDNTDFKYFVIFVFQLVQLQQMTTLLYECPCPLLQQITTLLWGPCPVLHDILSFTLTLG